MPRDQSWSCFEQPREEGAAQAPVRFWGLLIAADCPAQLPCPTCCSCPQGSASIPRVPSVSSVCQCPLCALCPSRVPPAWAHPAAPAWHPQVPPQTPQFSHTPLKLKPANSDCCPWHSCHLFIFSFLFSLLSFLLSASDTGVGRKDVSGEST